MSNKIKAKQCQIVRLLCQIIFGCLPSSIVFSSINSKYSITVLNDN